MLTIKALSAIEILDSRARPTLAVNVEFADGVAARRRRAVRCVDGDSGGTRAARRGYGPLRRAGRCASGRATSTARSPSGCAGNFADLAEVDAALIELDGTPNKTRLGANAIVGVSIAVARAIASAAGEPLWQSLTPGRRHTEDARAALQRRERRHARPKRARLPRVHARTARRTDGRRGGPCRCGDLRGASGKLVEAGLSAGLGDEGGFAPELTSPEEVLALLVSSIEDAGYKAGRDGVALAMDPASSEFCRDGAYHVAGEALSTDEMITRYEADGRAVPGLVHWRTGSRSRTGTGGSG